MWLNEAYVTDSAIRTYRASLLRSCPNHVVIDGLFNQCKLNEVLSILQQSQRWQVQKHTYSALYVDNVKWQNSRDHQRFVQRDIWRREAAGSHSGITDDSHATKALEFLFFLRSGFFLNFLSRIFNVSLTDMNVAEPNLNTNYFRLGPTDFVRQHADDSPGREVCMLLYLNSDWKPEDGGELTFLGDDNKTIRISPTFNRCVLFDPSSKGSEHWVEPLNSNTNSTYRFNVTSWYWSE